MTEANKDCGIMRGQRGRGGGREARMYYLRLRDTAVGVVTSNL